MIQEKIYVAGHRGIVGSAIVRHLLAQGVSKPDGPPRKWMNSSRLNALGWQAKVDLQHDLVVAYQNFVSKL